jgi:hypothetical protein
MANPANYQRTGTEPIRSNHQVKRSTDLNPGLKDSGTPSGGTKNTRAYEATKQSMNLTKPVGGNKDVWPDKVASYSDAET